jgi:hypothetical protein
MEPPFVTGNIEVNSRMSQWRFNPGITIEGMLLRFSQNAPSFTAGSTCGNARIISE